MWKVSYEEFTEFIVHHYLFTNEIKQTVKWSIREYNVQVEVSMFTLFFTLFELPGFLKQNVFFFFRLVTSVEQSKNSESPWGIEPSDFALRCSTTEPQRLYEVHKIRVLHTGRVSNVDSVMFDELKIFACDDGDILTFRGE